MDSFIHIFGKSIPIYGLCWVIGIVLAAGVALLMCKRYGLDAFDLTCACAFVLVGAIIGAKLLFIIVTLPTIIELRLSLLEIISGGFVFYGGLLGGILGLYIYTRMFKESFPKYADLLSTVTPLGHACGRVGCLLGGCCYGMPYDGPFCWVYTDSIGNPPLGVPLFPIQLLEAALLMILFIVLVILYFKRVSHGTIAAVYLCTYAVMRFILEYFRGDAVRGGLWVLSTSQIISLLILIAVGVIVYIRKKRAHSDRT